MYVYDNEDNAPMIDEKWEAAREKAAQKQRDAMDGLADMLELTGGCRECEYFTELAEGFIDKNGLIANEQFDFLKMQCSICGGKGTGKPKDEQHRKWIEKDWADLMEWVKDIGLRYRCNWCPNVYRVYGQYKDPDDEWKAMEDLCCNCKYFGED
jgi:hypothetical protein